MQVDLSRLNFTRQELAIFVRQCTGRKPDRLDAIQVAWHVDGYLDRTLTVYTGKNKSFTVNVLRRAEEDTPLLTEWIDSHPMDVAIIDLHRSVQLSLRMYYLTLVSDVDHRPDNVVARIPSN